MKFLFATALLLAAATANAAEASQDTSIRIFRGGMSPKTVAVESLPAHVVIRSKTPHRELNPEGKISEFEGVDIRRLLGLTGQDKDLLVHFIASDGYISTVPASVLLKTKAILAWKENGRTLDTRQGGLQVIYPTEGKDAVEEAYAKKAAFWCWYVRSIVVGNLPNRLAFGKTNLRSLPAKAEAFSFEPPSVFQIKKTECPKTYRAPLSQVTKSESVTLDLLSGQKKKISTADFDLIFTKGQKAIPVECGGPFAIANRAKLKILPSPIFAKDIDVNVVSIEETR